MDRPEVLQVKVGSGEQRKMEKTGCKIIYGAPVTLTVKGLMMMMMLLSCGVLCAFMSLSLFLCKHSHTELGEILCVQLFSCINMTACMK